MEEQGFTVPRGRGKRGDLYQQAYETQFQYANNQVTPQEEDRFDVSNEIVGE